MHAHNNMKSKTLPPMNLLSSAVLSSSLFKMCPLERNSLTDAWKLLKASVSWVLMPSMFLSVLWFCICVILVSERNFVVDVEVGVFVLLWN